MVALAGHAQYAAATRDDERGTEMSYGKAVLELRSLARGQGLQRAPQKLDLACPPGVPLPVAIVGVVVCVVTGFSHILFSFQTEDAHAHVNWARRRAPSAGHSPGAGHLDTAAELELECE